MGNKNNKKVKIYLIECAGFNYVDSTEDDFKNTNVIMKELSKANEVKYNLLEEVNLEEAEKREFFWIVQYYRKKNNLNENKLGNYSTDNLLNVVGDIKETKIAEFNYNDKLIATYPSITYFCDEHNMDRGYATRLLKGEKRTKKFKLIPYEKILNEKNKRKELKDKTVHEITNRFNGNKNKKAVCGVNLNTGEKINFRSLYEAEKKGYNRTSIKKCLNGKMKKYKNFEWKLL